MTKTRKCGSCAYSRSYARHYDYSMKRLYVRYKNSYKPIGWICPYCNSVVFDRYVSSYIKAKKRSKGKALYVRFRNSYKKIGFIYPNGRHIIFQNAMVKPELKHNTYAKYYHEYLKRKMAKRIPKRNI